MLLRSIGFYYVTFSPSRSSRCETNKPLAVRVRVEGYTQKNSKRDTIKVFKPKMKASVFRRWLVMWADIPGTNYLLDEVNYLGVMISNPPMYGRRTSGIVTEASSFW